MDLNHLGILLADLSGADPILLKVVLLCGGILIFAFLLKALSQPYIIAYMLAGVVLGQYGMELISETKMISAMGSFGLILLLFFIGMEISITDLIANWKMSVIGTLTQVLLSILIAYLVGSIFAWPLKRVITIGFVISLSSTAVIIKLLQERNELNSEVGQNVVGILLTQDIIIVPMIILLNYIGGEVPSFAVVGKQLLAGIIIVGIIWYVMRKGKLSLPFQGFIRKDHEIQVFLAIAICFGLSFLTATLGLSSALGAFVAGILVSSFRATHWVHESLHAFRVVFVALFFVSMGMLLDLRFMQANLELILIFVFMVLVVNNLINATVFRIFKQNWRESIYAGAILAQIGEFSFLIGSTAYMSGIVTNYTYNLTISIISVSLLVSPLWISLIRSLLHPDIKSHSRRIIRW